VISLLARAIRLFSRPGRPVEDQVERVVAIYVGRFQPFGRHHFAVYEQVRSRFPETYLGTVRNRDRKRNPLSFEEKRAFMARYGIPGDRVFRALNPYRPAAFLRRFDPRSTAVVFAVGARDAERMARIGRGEAYYKPLPEGLEGLLPYPRVGYFLCIPHVVATAGALELSGTAIRERLGDPSLPLAEKRELFRAAFGWYDEALFETAVRRFTRR
jgi:hypothetical protein